MRAKEIMTKGVICIDVKSSIFDAADLLLSERVSALPVVDDKGSVIGIVSEADLMRRPEIGSRWHPRPPCRTAARPWRPG